MLCQSYLRTTHTISWLFLRNYKKLCQVNMTGCAKHVMKRLSIKNGAIIQIIIISCCNKYIPLLLPKVHFVKLSPQLQMQGWYNKINLKREAGQLLGHKFRVWCVHINIFLDLNYGVIYSNTALSQPLHLTIKAP